MQQSQEKIVRNAIKEHKDLAIYKIAYSVSMEIFKLSKNFPDDEKFSLTSQIRRSSRTGKLKPSVDLGEKDVMKRLLLLSLNDSEANRFVNSNLD